MTTKELLDDRYRLGEPLGHGGACDVFLGRDERLQRDVAVKVLRGEGIGDAGRMATEAQLLASFNHPGLVQVFDAGEVDGQPYVVLELIEGTSLASRLRSGTIPARQVATIGAAVADALASVHERGVVHRDVSPGNVLCGADGRVRLADFGIARLVDDARRTTASVALGTPAYMAPEQVRGHAATPAADIYALGLVLAESLTGRRAFEGSGPEVALARLTRSPDVTTGVPDAWRPLLSAMTQLDAGERPSATEVRDRLTHLASASAARTAAVAVAVPDGRRQADADAATAPTAMIRVDSGGTEVMPVPVASGTVVPLVDDDDVDQPPDQARRRQQRVVVAVLAGFLFLAALALAVAGDHADLPDVPSPTTAPPATEQVVNVPTTTTPVTAPAPREPKGKGRSHHGKGG